MGGATTTTAAAAAGGSLDADQKDEYQTGRKSRGGTMTITLRAPPAGGGRNEPEKKEKVKFHLSNPEMVAERVLEKLATKFPPESVVTVMTSPRRDVGSIHEGRGGSVTPPQYSRSLSPAAISTRQSVSPSCDNVSGGGGVVIGSSLSSSYRGTVGGGSRGLQQQRTPSVNGPATSALPLAVTVQLYFVSPELETAVPVSPEQMEVKLDDGCELPVTEDDVLAVFYDAKGFVVGSKPLAEIDDVSRDTDVVPGMPTDKNGIAWYVQDYFISDELTDAVPILHTQTTIRTDDGSELPVKAEQLISVFYGDTGVALFHRLPDDSVHPGAPTLRNKGGIAHAAVLHQIEDDFGDGRLVAVSPTVGVSSRSPASPPSYVGLYDATGEALYFRKPSGALCAGGLTSAATTARSSVGGGRSKSNTRSTSSSRSRENNRVAHHVEYYYQKGDSEDAGMVWIRDMTKPIRSPDGRTMIGSPFLAEDVVLVLKDSRNEIIQLGEEEFKRTTTTTSSQEGRIIARKSGSTLTGTILSRSSGNKRSIGSQQQQPSVSGSTASRREALKKLQSRMEATVGGSSTSGQGSRMNDRHDSRSATSTTTMRKSRSSEQQQEQQQSPQQVKASSSSVSSSAQNRRPRGVATDDSVAVFASSNETAGGVSSSSPVRKSGSMKGSNELRGAAASATSSNLRSSVASSSLAMAGHQQYYLLSDMNYAIPVIPGQTYVKLADGEKRAVEASKVYTVEYDHRGLPCRTTIGHDEVVCSDWAFDRPGVAFKLQQYFSMEELVYAVPIVPGQTHVVVTNGGSIPIKPANIITVFYDAKGKPAFYYEAGGLNTKVRPGGCAKEGIAQKVQYFALFDNPGLSDVAGTIAVPINASQTTVSFYNFVDRKIDRDRVSVSYFDNRHSTQPTFSQLENGSLVYGALGSFVTVLDNFKEDQRPPFTPITSSSITPPDITTIGAPGAAAEDLSARMTSFAPTGCSTPALPPTEYRMTSSGDYEKVTYVEVPTEVEVIKHVPMKKVEIIERRVPKVEVQIVEKVIEVPEVVYVDKPVEVERIEYTTTVVKKKEVIEKPVEQIRYVPKVEVKQIEKIIEVPEVIEVPRLEIIERKTPVEKFHDKKQQAVVAQTVTPVIRQSGEVSEEVECLQLEPSLIPVDVFVPKLVRSSLIPIGNVQSKHKEVQIPPSHFNSLTIQMNPHFQTNFEKLPLIRASNGSIPLLPADARLSIIQPSEEIVRDLLVKADLVKKTITTTPSPPEHTTTTTPPPVTAAAATTAPEESAGPGNIISNFTPGFALESR